LVFRSSLHFPDALYLLRQIPLDLSRPLGKRKILLVAANQDRHSVSLDVDIRNAIEEQVRCLGQAVFVLAVNHDDYGFSVLQIVIS
jgi:hypothetical protein